MVSPLLRTLAQVGRHALRAAVWLLLILSLRAGDLAIEDTASRVRQYTRPWEFDYVSWTLGALFNKERQAVLDLPRYLAPAQQRQVVLDYLDLVRQLDRVEADIADFYAHPEVKNPEVLTAPLVARRARLLAEWQRQRLAAEAVLEHQISTVIGDMGLSLGGQPLPPVLYHVTPLPMALIVSPRTVIRQEADISLQPDLPLETITHLEQNVERGLNVSALVVPVGGIGVYPSMVMRSDDLAWLVETVAHEWIHNYLTLRPLGMLYFASPQMRTINETTANLAGKEIARAVLARYYPEFLPPEQENEAHPPAPGSSPPARTFDFRAEMHTTRVTVDALLAAGKVEEAEAYMEARRRFFWEHGYHIRRLNQAYFAFYGAYADTPVGPQGRDPVGEAVRTLRARSPNLAAFLRRIAWVTSYADLQRLVEETAPEPGG
ncbi:hypothetical protein SE15_13765 [Thermanaerothrix daxensis]|uniref:Uncharacterized protein n=1 Tax=Thermanaerothrix daxensis TaxID=869279 RepID=A0A0P6XNW6_9CHLR|nr:hypothetical protein SE15_13765 [Thermanaerothrix daxensis]